jgi:ArsR family transcriptional regulator
MLNHTSRATEPAGGEPKAIPDQELAQVLKALGEPTRLSVFNLLMEGIQCNCEIAERLDLSLSLVSHHVHALLKVGLVRSERDPDDARWIYYSLDRVALARLAAAMGHLLDADRIQPRSPVCGPRGVAGPEARRY